MMNTHTETIVELEDHLQQIFKEAIATDPQSAYQLANLQAEVEVLRARAVTPEMALHAIVKLCLERALALEAILNKCVEDSLSQQASQERI